MKLILVIISSILSTYVFSQKIFLLKQWHLPPKVETLDVEVSKKLAQFTNQKDLYDKAVALVIKDKVSTVLSEGCEKLEIDQNFSKKFNGWTYAELEKNKKENKNYADVLTLLPLKLEVFFQDKIKTLCIDNEEYIKKSQLVLSDIRAYVGYAERLEEFKLKNDQQSYDRYAKSLLTNDEMSKKVDAIAIARSKALNSVQAFEKINQQREEIILNNIISLKLKNEERVALILGGFHVNGLADKLKSQKMEVEIYTPMGYVDNDIGLLEDVKRKLQ